MSETVTKVKKRWKLCKDDGVPRTFPPTHERAGEPHVVAAHTRGEARAEFKRHYGEKPPKNGKRQPHTTRKRLPVGYRVRLESY